MNLPDVLSEKGDSPMNYVYTVIATSVVFFTVNLFILLWYIVRKRNKARKCRTLKSHFILFFLWYNDATFRSLYFINKQYFVFSCELYESARCFNFFTVCKKKKRNKLQGPMEDSPAPGFLPSTSS